MQNMVLNALTQGGSLVNQSMNVARSMLDSINKSINTSSKIAFGLQKMFRDAEADKFLQKMQLERLMLEKQKQKLYAANVMSQIAYRDAMLGINRDKLGLDKMYKQGMLNYYNGLLGLKNKQLQLKQQSSSQTSGSNPLSVLSSAYEQALNYKPEPLQWYQPKNKQLQPYFANIIQSRSNYPYNYETLNAYLTNLEKMASDPKYANNKELIKYIKTVKPLVVNLKKQAEAYDKQVYKNIQSMLNNKDSLFYNLVDDNKKNEILASIANKHGRALDIAVNKALQDLDTIYNNRTTPATPIDYNTLGTEVVQKYKKLNPKAKKQAEQRVNTIVRTLGTTTNPTILENASENFSGLTPEQRKNYQTLAQEIKSNIWTDPQLQEIARGMYEAVTGESEDVFLDSPNYNQDQLLKTIINYSLAKTGKDLVTPILREYGNKTKNFIDNPLGTDMPFFGKNYGYNVNVMSQDDLDHTRIALSQLRTIYKMLKQINSKEAKKLNDTILDMLDIPKDKVDLEGWFDDKIIRSKMSSLKKEEAIMKLITQNPKYKKALERYLISVLPKKSNLSDDDKTLIFSLLIRPAMLEYRNKNSQNNFLKTGTFLDKQ